MHKSGRLERGVELPGDAHIGLGHIISIVRRRWCSTKVYVLSQTAINSLQIAIKSCF